MPPKKATKSKEAGVDKRAKQNDKGAEKSGTSKKKPGTNAAKCKTPLVRGSVMAQRRLPPTVCCPSQGAAVRCCLPGPGCWPC